MLYKLNTKNVIQIWDAKVNDCTVTYTWGQKDGKKQTKSNTYTVGKNIGRSNETTPQQQAQLEMESVKKKKLDSGYVEDIETVLQNTIVPRPMLANDYNKHLKKIQGNIYIQPKLDGCRCIANTKTGKLYSRKGKVLNLVHISSAILEMSWNSEWIDGELYCHGLDFQSTMSLIKKYVPESTCIQYHVYDCISNEPFGKRFIPFKNTKYIICVETVKSDNIEKYHSEFIKQGYEGTMVRLDKEYEVDKRSFSLFKYKDFQQEEYTIVDFLQEKHKDTLGSICLCDGEKTFNARPSMSHDRLLEIWENQKDYIGKKASVKFFEKTNSGIPRFPILIGIREEWDM